SFSVTSPVLDAGTLVNQVTVGGHDDEGSAASASDSTTVAVSDVPPSITVAKTAPAAVLEGSTITYQFSITNTSVVSTDPVSISSVVDDVLGNLTAAAQAAWRAQGNAGAIVLTPGQIFTFSFTTGVQKAGTVTNTVTVSGHDDEATPTSAGDSATVSVNDAA